MSYAEEFQKNQQKLEFSENVLELSTLNEESDFFATSHSNDSSTVNKLVYQNNIPMILFICWSGNFLTLFDGTIVSTTMSNIASDFNQSHLVTWIATSYLLTSTSFQPLYGKTSDILGRRELLLLAQILFTTGLFLSSISNNVQTLSLARAIAGMGGAGMVSLTSIIISDLVSLSERSVYIGYGTMISSVAQMLGGPVGGWFIVSIGWRFMFLIQVPFLLICIFLLYKIEIYVDHIPPKEERWTWSNLKRIDWMGILLLNVIVSVLIFQFSLSLSWISQFLLCLILVISLIGFIYVENYKVMEKIIDFEILKGIIGSLGIVNGINTLILYMILFILPLYLQIVQDITIEKIGYFTMFFVIATAVGSLLAGVIIRKYNESELETMKIGIKTSFWFLVIQIIGFILIFSIIFYNLPLNSSTHYWIFQLILSLIISGIGAGGYSVGIAIFIIGKVGKKGQASANTVVSLIKSLGNVLGVSISLSWFSNEVKLELTKYFQNDDVKEYIDKLTKDSKFIKDGLPHDYLLDVLNIYKNALIKSFHPGLYLSAIGVIIMFVCFLKVRRWKEN